MDGGKHPIRDGDYLLLEHVSPSRADNPDYEDLEATDEMRTLARLRAVVDPLDLAVGQTFTREDIPALFGETFNVGSWNVGHVVLNAQRAHVLLVTLSKRGKVAEHRYLDHWIDECTFHWQSQNATTPTSRKGLEIIEHAARGIAIHLFVRDDKLAGGKGAPFVYHGRVKYQSHQGSAPMNVVLRVEPYET